MVSFGFSRFQGCFLWFQVGFHDFSRFRVGFLRFQVGFEGKSWLQVGFYSYRSVFIVTGRFFMVPCVFYVCMAPGLVSMIQGGFLSSLRVPGLFKSELSAKPAK